jgi:hypothetical protein
LKERTDGSVITDDVSLAAHLLKKVAVVLLDLMPDQLAFPTQHPLETHLAADRNQAVAASLS